MMAGIASTDSGIIFVSLVGYSDRKLTAMEIAQKLTDELYMAVPGAECFAFIPPSIPGLGITSGVSVEVQDLEGRGTAYLLEQSERLMDSLRKLPSVASVTTQFNAGRPPAAAAHRQGAGAGFGRGLRDVLYGDLTTLLGGAYVNNFTRFGKLYQTYIQAAPAYRMDKRSLDSYYVASSSGESVPVASLVEVADTVGVEYVSQFNLYRSIGLTVTPAARHLDDDRHAGHHPHGRAGTARRRRHGMERHLLSGSQRFEDRRAGLPAGAGLRVPRAGGPVRIVGAAAGDSDERSRGGAGRRALHRRLTPAQRPLRQ